MAEVQQKKDSIFVSVCLCAFVSAYVYERHYGGVFMRFGGVVSLSRH